MKVEADNKKKKIKQTEAEAKAKAREEAKQNIVAAKEAEKSRKLAENQAKFVSREKAKQDVMAAKEAEKARKLAAKQAGIPLNKQLANLFARVARSAREQARNLFIKVIRAVRKQARRLKQKVTYQLTKTSSNLYIDDSSIKLLVAKGERIRFLHTFHLEEGLVEDGVVLNPEEVATGINALLQRAKIKKKGKIGVCLTGLNSITRVITMPAVPRSILDEAVKREAARELPLPLSEVYLSWQLIKYSALESSIFAIAQRRIIVDALVDTLRLAKVKPYFLAIAPLQLARAVNRQDCMVVDVKRTEADLVIVEGGIPTLVRGLQFSRNESPEDKLPTLLEEMKRNLKFYGSRSKVAGVAAVLPVFVTGEFDGNKNLFDLISRELKCEVLAVTTGMISPDGEGVKISDYMANIGMANHAVRKSAGFNSVASINVNLLPAVYRSHGLSAATLSFAAAGILIPAFLGFVSFQMANVMDGIRTGQAELDSARIALEQSTVSRAERLASINEVRSNIAGSQKTYDSLTVIRSMVANNNQDVNEIMSLIKKDLATGERLRTVSYNGNGSLELSGVTPNEEDVLAYIEELSQKYPPAQISLRSMSRNNINNLVEFVLNVGIGR